MNSKPASKVIVDDIKEKIRIGMYLGGASLPSENELAERYDVSRATVQKALSIIVAENLIYSIPGKGYFVREVSFNKYSFEYDEFKGLNVKLLGVDIISPPPEVIYHLHVHPKKKVLRIRSIAYDSGIPAIYDIKYVQYVPGMPTIEQKINFTCFSELASSFASPYGLSKNISFRCDFADDEVCEILKIDKQSKCIVAEQKICNEYDECLGWGIEYFNPKNFKIKMVR